MDYDIVLLGLFLSTLFKINNFFEEVLTAYPRGIPNEIYNIVVVKIVYFCLKRSGMLIFTWCCRRKMKKADFVFINKNIVDTILVASCYYYICYL